MPTQHMLDSPPQDGKRGWYNNGKPSGNYSHGRRDSDNRRKSFASRDRTGSSSQSLYSPQDARSGTKQAHEDRTRSMDSNPWAADAMTTPTKIIEHEEEVCEPEKAVQNSQQTVPNVLPHENATTGTDELGVPLKADEFAGDAEKTFPPVEVETAETRKDAQLIQKSELRSSNEQQDQRPSSAEENELAQHAKQPANEQSRSDNQHDPTQTVGGSEIVEQEAEHTNQRSDADIKSTTKAPITPTEASKKSASPSTSDNLRAKPLRPIQIVPALPRTKKAASKPESSSVATMPKKAPSNVSLQGANDNKLSLTLDKGPKDKGHSLQEKNTADGTDVGSPKSAKATDDVHNKKKPAPAVEEDAEQVNRGKHGAVTAHDGSGLTGQEALNITVAISGPYEGPVMSVPQTEDKVSDGASQSVHKHRKGQSTTREMRGFESLEAVRGSKHQAAPSTASSSTMSTPIEQSKRSSTGQGLGGWRDHYDEIVQFLSESTHDDKDAWAKETKTLKDRLETLERQHQDAEAKLGTEISQTMGKTLRKKIKKRVADMKQLTEDLLLLYGRVQNVGSSKKPEPPKVVEKCAVAATTKPAVKRYPQHESSASMPYMQPREALADRRLQSHEGLDGASAQVSLGLIFSILALSHADEHQEPQRAIHESVGNILWIRGVNTIDTDGTSTADSDPDPNTGRIVEDVSDDHDPRERQRRMGKSITDLFVRSQGGSTQEAVTKGNGLGLFLSGMQNHDDEPGPSSIAGIGQDTEVHEPGRNDAINSGSPVGKESIDKKDKEEAVDEKVAIDKEEAIDKDHLQPAPDFGFRAINAPASIDRMGPGSDESHSSSTLNAAPGSPTHASNDHALHTPESSTVHSEDGHTQAERSDPPQQANPQQDTENIRPEADTENSENGKPQPEGSVSFQQPDSQQNTGNVRPEASTEHGEDGNPQAERSDSFPQPDPQQDTENGRPDMSHRSSNASQMSYAKIAAARTDRPATPTLPLPGDDLKDLPSASRRLSASSQVSNSSQKSNNNNNKGKGRASSSSGSEKRPTGARGDEWRVGPEGQWQAAPVVAQPPPSAWKGLGSSNQRKGG